MRWKKEFNSFWMKSLKFCKDKWGWFSCEGNLKLICSTYLRWSVKKENNLLIFSFEEKLIALLGSIIDWIFNN
jgi:hypothetical protein